MTEQHSPPNPVERIARAVAYGCVGLAGVYLMVTPSPSMSGALGQWLTIIWSAFLLVALPAVVVTMLGRYRAEYALLPWFTGALLLAVLHEWLSLGEGSHTLPRALLDTALMCWFAVRFISLHQLVRVNVKDGDAWIRSSK